MKDLLLKLLSPILTFGVLYYFEDIMNIVSKIMNFLF